jgi:nuclear GTP-binding protein
VRDPVEAVGALFEKVNKEELLVMYRIADFKNYKEFLMNIAESRVKYKKGGILDLEGAAKLVLHDWAVGKIKYYVTPQNYGKKGIEIEN